MSGKLWNKGNYISGKISGKKRSTYFIFKLSIKKNVNIKYNLRFYKILKSLEIFN